MATIETIKIEGDASEFNKALEELNTRIESLDTQLTRANTEIKEFGDKGEKAIKGVKQEVKETGKGLKDLIKNLGGLAIISKLGDAASEAFTGNQKVVDTMNTGLFTAQLAVSGLIEYLTGSKGLSEAFGSIFQDAKDLVRLQKESQLAEVRRTELQFIGQKLAEEQRQIRDEERNSLTERIQANERINEILNDQLAGEKETVNIKIAAAEAEFNKLPNLENEIALRQANIELLDIDLKNNALTAQLALYDQDSVAYQQILNEKQQLHSDYSLQLTADEQKDFEFQREIQLAKFQLAQDTFTAIGNLSAAFAGEDEESKRQQFELQKKLSLASAIVSGILAVQNAFKTASESAYAVNNPAYPFIQAGLAGAFAAAQVASIAKTQFDSQDASSLTTSTSSPSQPAQFNIVGQSGTNQLVEGLAGQFDKPIRAYVVSGEVISGSELDRRRLRTATFP